MVGFPFEFWSFLPCNYDHATLGKRPHDEDSGTIVIKLKARGRFCPNGDGLGRRDTERFISTIFAPRGTIGCGEREAYKKSSAVT